MPKRLLEQVRGVGAVYAGDLLLRTTAYDVSIWSEAGTAGSSADTISIDGHIDVTGMGEAIVLAGADTLTLELEDGRRLAVVLLGTTGHIAGSGGPQPAR